MGAGPIPLRTLEVARDAALEAMSEHADHELAVSAAVSALRERAGEKPAVCVLVREEDRLWVMTARGYDNVNDGLRLDEGVIARAVRSGAGQFVREVGSDPDYVVATAGALSEYAAPLGEGAPALGAIDLESHGAALPEGTPEALAPLVAEIAKRVAKIPSDNLATLARLLVRFSSLRDREAIAELSARALGRLLGLESAQVNLRSGGELILASHWRLPESRLPAFAPGVLEEIAERVGPHAIHGLADLDSAVIPEIRDDPRKGVLWIPLRAGGKDIGMLVGGSRRPLAFSREQSEVVALLAANTAASLDAVATLERERQAALTDALTGLPNHRAFHEILERRLHAAVAAGAPLSLALLDLDDLKLVNDSAGHSAGDRVLTDVAATARACLRPDDEVFRIGGDEFAMVLPGTHADDARAAVERLRAELRAGPGAPRPPLTLSAGVATFPEHAQSKGELLHKADLALYGAKRAGRDRCVVFGGETAGAAGRTRAEARHDELHAGMRNPTVRSALLAELAELTDVIDAFAGESDPQRLLGTLAYRLTLVLGATACVVSRLEGNRLRDHASFVHEPHGTPALEDEDSYDLDSFPASRAVLERRVPYMCTLEDVDVDAAEAAYMRRAGMRSLLMVPLVAGSSSWGLIEVLDVAVRRFGDADVSIARLVASQAGAIIARAETARDVEQVYRETLGSLATALEIKDPSTSHHTNVIAELAVAVAARLGCDADEVRAVELGALLHDIGKIRVPESILRKAGPLDEAQWQVMRRHTEVGEAILRPIASLSHVRPLVRSSHERWDGTGYPDGLAREQIPLGARIIAVCDAYHAMIEDRVYRRALSRAAAREELIRERGSQFDPRCVDAFLALLDERARPAGEPLRYREAEGGPAHLRVVR